MISLIPIGKLDGSLLALLQKEMTRIFHEPVVVRRETLDIRLAYNRSRKQFSSSQILSRSLSKLRRQRDEKILAVVDVDLYAEPLNFVFGEADPSSGIAVMSLARLKQEFYNRPADETLFRKRALTEAVHELGHVYGLRHCDNSRCVMFFSNSLADTDKKGYHFCSRCSKRIM